jgi:hypothetical protein
MATAVYFRQKAEQCRRLATSIMSRNDPTAKSLNALATEFDSKAASLEAETAAAMMIGYEDDIGDRSSIAPNGDADGAESKVPRGLGD